MLMCQLSSSASFRGAVAKRRRARNPYSLTCSCGFRALGLRPSPGMTGQRFCPNMLRRSETLLEDAVKPAANTMMLSLVVTLAAWNAPPARAADITIFLNQATASGVRELAAGFEKATGHKVDVSFQAVGPALNQKIVSGAPGDLVSLGIDQFDDYIKQGKVVAGSVVEYARVGNGVAVKAGAPKPDISTAEAFRRAMLNAKSIGHTNAGTGPYNTRLFQKLGIYDQIKDKIKIVAGKPVAVAVAEGEVEIGIQQTNVIQPVAGTTYLGPLPPDLIEYGR